MADVMLVLLIIFMIVTPLLAAGFQAQMPTGVNLLRTEEKPDDVVLGIDRDGNYYLNTRPVPRSQLQGQLTDIFTARTVDKILYLKADSALKMRTVQEAVNIARMAGVRVIGAISEQRRGTEPTVSQERRR
jgi:biopolymer transport protein ExbD